MTKVVTIISLFLFTTLFACAQKQTKTTETKETSVAVKKQSISKVLSDKENVSMKERVALYLKLKKEQPDAYNFENEDELTMYGYRHLWDNKTQDAIEVFKLIASQFPNSSNAYDSLG
ncbi:MAG TPA: peptidase S41, partial [Flavobacteriaceae bacterium]